MLLRMLSLVVPISFICCFFYIVLASNNILYLWLTMTPQWGGTPIDSVLWAATAVKIGQGFEQPYHYVYLWLWVSSLKICLTVDQASKLQSELTVDYGEYFRLTVDLYFDRDYSLEYRVYWSTMSIAYQCSKCKGSLCDVTTSSTTKRAAPFMYNIMLEWNDLH